MAAVLTLDHVLELARQRGRERDEFLERVRTILHELVDESADLEPFQHGCFLDQLQHELVTLRCEQGDPRALARRARRNQKIAASVRLRVYQRDDYTCQDCGWRSPRDLEERRIANRSGKFLTIDHIVPRSEGGPNHWSNLQTLCSTCNPIKGKTLPDALPAHA